MSYLYSGAPCPTYILEHLVLPIFWNTMSYLYSGTPCPTYILEHLVLPLFWNILSHLYSGTPCPTYTLEHPVLPTESPKKNLTWKTTWGLLICILIRMKGPSIKTNTRKISVGFTVFIQIFERGLVYLQERYILS